MKRAAHLGHCLESINNVNDPLDCHDRASKFYVAGEETGTETLSGLSVWKTKVATPL